MQIVATATLLRYWVQKRDRYVRCAMQIGTHCQDRHLHCFRGSAASKLGGSAGDRRGRLLNLIAYGDQFGIASAFTQQSSLIGLYRLLDRAAYRHGYLLFGIIGKSAHAILRHPNWLSSMRSSGLRFEVGRLAYELAPMCRNFMRGVDF